uniref:Fanconi anemia-associated protein of 20 kDa n=1 Tax=Odobenus rosmarus divergens TaxID=9708 RepID=UPI00063C96B4|nr:PREDICTED: Fanconi anemia-associated protein of 20 kDa [Odobenus rosmarus divergens]
MEAARRPRSGLRSRRPPPAGSPAEFSLTPPSGRGGPLPGDGGECARPWAELLRAGSADLSPDGELPSLPAFPGPEPGRGPERTAPPEVFTVGARTFSWTPFPQAPRGGGDPGRSYRVLLGARGRSGSPARSPQRRPAPQPRGIPGPQEQLWEATLRSCPMCQANFAPSLTPLDIDGHLAQCLAESTEDVAW